MLVIAAQASADSYTWVGGSSSSWTTPANWADTTTPSDTGVGYPHHDLDIAVFSSGAPAISVPSGMGQLAEIMTTDAFTGTLTVSSLGVDNLTIEAGTFDMPSASSVTVGDTTTEAVGTFDIAYPAKANIASDSYLYFVQGGELADTATGSSLGNLSFTGGSVHTGSDITASSLATDSSSPVYGDQGPFPPYSLTITGLSKLGASLGSMNGVKLEGAVTLASPTGTMSITQATAASGSITFGSSVDGAVNLMVSANVDGGVFFEGDVGNGTQLTGLTVGGLSMEDNSQYIGVSGTADFNARVFFNADASQAENVIQAPTIQFSESPQTNSAAPAGVVLQGNAEFEAGTSEFYGGLRVTGNLTNDAQTFAGPATGETYEVDGNVILDAGTFARQGGTLALEGVNQTLSTGGATLSALQVEAAARHRRGTADRLRRIDAHCWHARLERKRGDCRICLGAGHAHRQRSRGGTHRRAGSRRHVRWQPHRCRGSHAFQRQPHAVGRRQLHGADDRQRRRADEQRRDHRHPGHRRHRSDLRRHRHGCRDHRRERCDDLSRGRRRHPTRVRTHHSAKRLEPRHPGQWNDGRDDVQPAERHRRKRRVEPRWCKSQPDIRRRLQPGSGGRDQYRPDLGCFDRRHLCRSGKRSGVHGRRCAVDDCLQRRDRHDHRYAECDADGGNRRLGLRHGHRERWHLVPRDMLSYLCRRADGSADRDTGERVNVRRMVRRGLQRDRVMHGHDDRGTDGHGHICGHLGVGRVCGSGSAGSAGSGSGGSSGTGGSTGSGGSGSSAGSGGSTGSSGSSGSGGSPGPSGSSGSGGLSASSGTTSTLSVGHTSVSGSSVKVPVGCTGATSCQVKLTLTVVETLHGKKVVAIAAKATKKTVVVGSGSAVLTGGRTQAIKLTLNATGKRLIAKYHVLKTKLAATLSGRAVGSPRTVVFKSPAKRE